MQKIKQWGYASRFVVPEVTYMCTVICRWSVKTCENWFDHESALFVFAMLTPFQLMRRFIYGYSCKKQHNTHPAL